MTESCPEPAGKHGEVMVRQQQCVDQRCQCINGNWFCIDTCTPLNELNCPPDERVFWDRFCCPRCKGTKHCNVTVSTINWLEEPPGPNGLPRFVSVFTPEGEKEIFTGSARQRIAKNNLKPEVTGDLLGGEFAEKTSLITVNPAQHLVTPAGRCVCTDGELRCSRPGVGIWHDSDCFYSHGHGQNGRYYAKGERWKAFNDECSDCQCLEDRRYTCSRAPCSSLFLCPPGQVPVITTRTDCCPSACEDIATAKARSHFNRISQEEETTLSETFPQQARNDVDESISFISPDGHCKPLGDLSTSGAGNSTPGILLPSKSLVIIRRSCVSLKCVCSSEGNWVCVDFCIPCEGVALRNSHDNSSQTLQPLQPRSADGCCPKCSASEDERMAYFGERFFIAIICFLAFLSLTLIFVIVACCICLRYRQKLKKLRTTEFNHSTKFHLKNETDPVTIIRQSAQSGLAIPLTISTNIESNSSPPIRLKIVPTTFAGHQSVHQSLLFNDKLDEALLSPSQFWRLSASYTSLSNPQQDDRNLSNPDFGESTPRKSLVTNSTGCSDNVSPKNSTKVIQTRFATEDIPYNETSTSNSSTHFGKSDPPETTKILDWRSRLRRNSTQTRTHFFPNAWKTVLSRSAVTATPPTNREETPFFKQPKPNQSEASQQLIQARNSASADSAEAV
ncbi:hypothetical protein Aperf_G00000094977 [Anoplocephala perfoliata]